VSTHGNGAVLTLAAGVIFGLGWGTLLVTFAPTMGARLAFATAWWLRRAVAPARRMPRQPARTAGQAVKRIIAKRDADIFPGRNAAARREPLRARKLMNALCGLLLQSHVPQRRTPALIGCADGDALLERGPVALRGQWVSRWEDRIVRRLMARYRSVALRPL